MNNIKIYLFLGLISILLFQTAATDDDVDNDSSQLGLLSYRRSRESPPTTTATARTRNYRPRSQQPNYKPITEQKKTRPPSDYRTPPSTTTVQTTTTKTATHSYQTKTRIPNYRPKTETTSHSYPTKTRLPDYRTPPATTTATTHSYSTRTRTPNYKPTTTTTVTTTVTTTTTAATTTTHSYSTEPAKKEIPKLANEAQPKNGKSITYQAFINRFKKQSFRKKAKNSIKLRSKNVLSQISRTSIGGRFKSSIFTNKKRSKGISILPFNPTSLTTTTTQLPPQTTEIPQTTTELPQTTTELSQTTTELLIDTEPQSIEEKKIIQYKYGFFSDDLSKFESNSF
jgi:hypothetical protein